MFWDFGAQATRGLRVLFIYLFFALGRQWMCKYNYTVKEKVHKEWDCISPIQAATAVLYEADMSHSH